MAATTVIGSKALKKRANGCAAAGGYWISESEGAREGGQVRIDSNVVCAFVMTEKKSQEREKDGKRERERIYYWSIQVGIGEAASRRSLETFLARPISG